MRQRARHFITTFHYKNKLEVDITSFASKSSYYNKSALQKGKSELSPYVNYDRCIWLSVFFSYIFCQSFVDSVAFWCHPSTCCEDKGDNTNWRAGGLCFRMKNVNFRRAGGLAGCTEDRLAGQWAAQKGGPAGCGKGQCRLQKKGSPPARPFPQPSLMCTLSAHLYVQPTGPSCCVAYGPALLCSSPARGKFMFFIWQHGRPARPALRLVLSMDSDSVPASAEYTPTLL